MKLTKEIQRTAVDGGDAQLLHSDFSAIAWNALKFGGYTGALGFLIGGTTGILRSANPVASGIATSVQYAQLGLLFSATRDAVLLGQGVSEPTPGSLTFASTVAGGISGAGTGLIFRGPRSIIPGFLCFAGVGAGGQLLLNAYNRERTRKTPRQSILNKIASSGWSPITNLSNEEYAKLLKEKLFKVEVEIALIDDKIAALRQEEATSTATENIND